MYDFFPNIQKWITCENLRKDTRVFYIKIKDLFRPHHVTWNYQEALQKLPIWKQNSAEQTIIIIIIIMISLYPHKKPVSLNKFLKIFRYVYSFCAWIFLFRYFSMNSPLKTFSNISITFWASKLIRQKPFSRPLGRYQFLS